MCCDFLAYSLSLLQCFVYVVIYPAVLAGVHKGLHCNNRVLML